MNDETKIDALLKAYRKEDMDRQKDIGYFIGHKNYKLMNELLKKIERQGKQLEIAVRALAEIATIYNTKEPNCKASANKALDKIRDL